jgi:osmotically-inducible protein OsmY
LQLQYVCSVSQHGIGGGLGRSPHRQQTAPVTVQNPKEITMNRTFNRIAASALFALTAGAFLPAHAAGNDADLAGQVQSALSSKLGTDAKDLTVTADNGSITLHGWAQGPQEEAKARFVASTVPGVHNAYSAVRTFSSDTND